MKHVIDLDADELARWAFQDKLSKFCPADASRPNGFETQMFKMGMLAGAEKVISLLKTPEALELTNNPVLSVWLETHLQNLLK